MQRGARDHHRASSGSSASTITVTVRDQFGNPLRGRGRSALAVTGGSGNTLTQPSATDRRQRRRRRGRLSSTTRGDAGPFGHRGRDGRSTQTATRHGAAGTPVRRDQLRRRCPQRPRRVSRPPSKSSSRTPVGNPVAGAGQRDRRVDHRGANNVARRGHRAIRAAGGIRVTLHAGGGRHRPGGDAGVGRRRFPAVAVREQRGAGAGQSAASSFAVVPAAGLRLHRRSRSR